MVQLSKSDIQQKKYNIACNYVILYFLKKYSEKIILIYRFMGHWLFDGGVYDVGRLDGENVAAKMY